MSEFTFDLQRFENETGDGTQANPYIVSTYDELKNTITAANSGSNIYIKLGGDITATASTDYPTIAAGATVNLDLNGHNITSTATYAFNVKGTLTLDDISNNKAGSIVHNKLATSSAINMNATGTFTMNGGYIESTGHTFYAGNTTDGIGTVNINGGKVKSSHSTGNDNVIQKISSDNLSSTQSVDGVLYIGSSYTPETSATSGKSTKVMDGGITYYYSGNEPTTVAQIGNGDSAVNYTSLKNAIMAAGENDTVTLASDVTLTNVIELNKSLTLDLNDHSVTHASNYAFKVYASTADATAPTFTVKDSGNNGKISGSSTLGVIYAGYSASKKGNFVLQGGTIENTNTTSATAAVLYGYSGSKITISNGTLTDTTSNIAINVTSADDVTISSGTAYLLNLDSKIKYYITEAAFNAAKEAACFSVGEGTDIKYFTTLANANTYVTAGETVKLLKDSSQSSITVNKNWTLDLNGHTLTSTGSSYAFSVKTTDGFTVKDSSKTDSSEGTGKITNGTKVQASGLIYFPAESGKFTLESGTLESTTYGVRTKTKAIFDMTGGKITTNADTFEYSGGNYSTQAVCNEGGTVNISGGEISAVGIAVNNSSDSTFNISGGTVKSSKTTAVISIGGTVNVSGTAYIEASTGIHGIDGSKITMSGGEIKSVANSDGKVFGSVQLGENNSSYTNKEDSFTMTSGKLSGESGVNLFNGGAKFEMSGGEINTTTFAVSNNGSPGYQDASITITNGTLNSSQETAIYHAGAGTTKISGGTITGGKTGVEVRAGSIEVTGGTITGTGKSFSSTGNGNGSTTEGAGIAIAQHTTEKAISVNINGEAQITGQVALSVTNPQNNPASTSDNKIDLEITGGKFTGEAASVFYQDGRSQLDVTGGTFEGDIISTYSSTAETGNTTISINTENGAKNAFNSTSGENNKGNVNIEGGSFKTDVSKYVSRDKKDLSAVIDGETKFYADEPEKTADIAKCVCVASITRNEVGHYYTTLEKAVADVQQAEETITLLQNVTLTATISVTKNITLDLNGKTMTAPTAAAVINIAKEQGSETLPTVTIKDGAEIKGNGIVAATSSTATKLIDNAGTLTLTDVKLDGTKLGGTDAYVVNNTGTLNVTGSTEITGSETIGSIKNTVGSVTIGTAEAQDATKPTITGDVLLSGNKADDSWDDKGLTLTAGTITGDLLLDENAAKAGALTKVTVAGIENYKPFSANEAITNANKNNLLAYADSGNYKVGLKGWTSSAEKSWAYIGETDATVKTGEAAATLTGAESTLTLTTAQTGTVTIPLDFANNTVLTSIPDGTYTILNAGSAKLPINVTGNAALKQITGGAGADTLKAGAEGVSLNGGAGNDSMVGGNGADVFIMSAGSDTISGYTFAETNSDTIQLTTAGKKGTFSSTTGVTFEISGNNLLVANTDAAAKSMKIKTSDGVTTEYFQNAYGIDGTLYIQAGGEYNASTYGTDAYNKVDLSGIPNRSATLSGFTEVTGFKPTGNRIDSLRGVPTNASVSGSNLVVTIDGKPVKINGAKDATIGVTDGTKNYTAKVGEITNVTDGLVTLTSYYSGNTYTAAESIKSVDATAIDKAVNLDGSAASKVTLLGGVGNDTLKGGDENASLDGGAGNDLVSLTSDAAIVNVSKGNDTVNVDSNVKAFTVVGFSAGDVIQINNGATTISLDGTSLKAGDLTIAGISAVAGDVYSWAEGESLKYQVKTLSGATLNGAQITFDATTKALSDVFTITGLSTSTGITLDDKVVTLGQSAVGGITENGHSVALQNNTTDNYSLALGNGVDTLKEEVSAAKWDTSVSGGKVAYYSASYGSYWSQEDTLTVKFNGAAGGESVFTVNGLKDGATTLEDPTTISGGYSVTLTESQLDVDKYKIIEISDPTKNALTINDVNKTAEQANVPATLIGSDGTYGYSSAYVGKWFEQINQGSISYHEAGTPDTFTISGLTSGLTIENVGISKALQVDGTTVTVNKEAVGDYQKFDKTYAGITLTSDDYTKLTLATDLTTAAGGDSTFTIVSDNSAVYQSNWKDAFFTSNNDTAYTFTPAVSKDTLFTLDGILTVDNSLVGENKVTLGSDNLTTQNVTLTNDKGSYTLVLNNVDAPVTTSAHFGDVSKGNVTYFGESIKAGYELGDGDTVVNYTGTKEADTLFTLDGILTVTGGEVTDGSTVVTLGSDNLTTQNVTLTNGKGTYNLSLASDVSAPTITSAHFEQSQTKATYLSDSNPEGWTLTSGTVIEYTKEHKADTLFAVDGVDTLTTSALSGTTVTVAKDQINSKATQVALTGNGYTLTLSGVATEATPTITTAFDGKVTENKATYKQTTSKNAYWNPTNDKTYDFVKDTVETATLFTLEGISTVADSNVSTVNSKVTLGKENLLTGTNATLNNVEGSYSFELSEDAAQSDTAAKIVQSGTKATYYDKGKTDGYTRSSDTLISYVKASDGDTLFAVDGVDTLTTGALSGTTVTVAKDQINSKATQVALTGDAYKLALSGVNTEATVVSTSSAFGSVSDNKATYTKTTKLSDYWNATDSQTYDHKDATTATSDLFTVSGVTTVDNSLVGENTLTLGRDNLSTTKATLKNASGQSYKITLTSDAAQNDIDAKVEQSGTKATYYNAGKTDGYSLGSGATVVSYVEASGGDTLFAVDGVDTLTTGALSGTTVTVAKDQINSKATQVALTGDGYKLALSGVNTEATVVSTSSAFGSVSSDNKATYTKTTKLSDYWNKTDSQTYDHKDASTATSDLFTVSGVTTVDNSLVGENTLTLGRDNLSTTKATLKNASGQSYKITLTSDAAQSDIVAKVEQSGTKATYYNAGKTDGYSLGSGATVVSYFKASGGDTLFAVDGVDTLTTGALSGTTVTVAKDQINSKATQVALTGDGYTLTLSGVDTQGTTTSTGKGFGSVSSDNKATYSETLSTNAYWNKTDSQTYDHKDATTATSDLFTVSGVTTVDNNLVSGTTLTLGRDNLSTTNATLNNASGQSYKITLTSDAAQSDVDAKVEQSGTTATYYDKGKTDGYSLGNGATVVSYVKASGGDSLFAVDGVDTLTTDALDGTTVTVAKDQINSKATKVALSGDGYTLTLSGVDTQGTTTSTGKGFGTMSGNKATYSETLATSAYWNATDKQTYDYKESVTTASGLFTISGVTTVDNGLVGENTLTLGRDNLSTTKATLKNASGQSYKITLDSDAAQSDIDAKVEQSGTKATYYNAGKTDGYSLGSGATVVSYVKASGGDSLFAVDGVDTLMTGALSGTTVTVAKDQINSKATQVALTGDGYKLALSGVNTEATVVSTSSAFGSVSSDNKATYTKTTKLSDYWNATDSQTYDHKDATTETSDLFTVSGVTTVDNSLVSGTTLTLGRDNLSTTKATLNNASGQSYKITLDSDAAQSDIDAKVEQSGTKATYYNAGKTDGYSLGSGATVVSYVKASGGDTLFAVDGVDTLTTGALSGTTVTVAKDQINSKATQVALTGDGYSLTLSGVNTEATVVSTGSAFGSVSSENKATYTKTTKLSDYWNATDSQTYDHKDATTATSDLFTLSGIANTKSITPSEAGVVTVAKSNIATGAKQVAVSGDGYTLTLSGVDTQGTTTSTGKGFGTMSGNKATYFETLSTNAYWNATDKQTYDYNESVTTASGLFTVSGVTTIDNGLVGENTLTLGRDNLSTTKATLKNSDGQSYKLALADGTAQEDTEVKGFEQTGTKATYTGAGKTDGYKLGSGDTVISYVKASEGASLFTVDGIATITNDNLKDTTVTLGESNLNKSDVTLTNAKGQKYSLALDSAVKGASYTDEHFGTVSDNSASYFSKSNTEGYELGNGDTVVNYTAAVDETTLFTLNGIKNTNSITPSDGVVTVAKSNIATGATQIAVTGDGYKLALSGVNTEATPTVTAAFGKVSSKNKVNYIQTTKTNAYWAATDEQTYDLTAAKSSKDTLFTLNGVTTIADSLVGDNVVTLGRDNLSTVKATLKNSDGQSYKLTLASDAAQSVIAAGFDGNVYKSKGKTDGYKLGNSATVISYVKASGAEDLFSVDGVDSTDNVKYKSKKITATKEDNAQLSLGAALNDTALTIDGFVAISGFSSTVHTLSGTPTDANANGDDLVVTTGDKDVTISGAATTVIDMVDDNKLYTAELTRLTDITDAEAKSVTLTGNFTNTYYGLHLSYGEGVTAVDGTNAGGKQLNITGAKSTADIALTGMANAKNSLTGGAGNDTLTGGSKNDLLKGGKGADIFVQSYGSRDTIADYSAADGDVISLQGALTNAKVIKSNVVLSTEAGDILVKNGVGQVLTTKVGDEETQSLFLDSEPTNASVSGEDLVVTAGDNDYTLAGKAADTVTFTVGDKYYAVEATRITDVTDAEAKSVTLSTDFTSTYYGLHMSSNAGVTAVDGTNASSKKFNLVNSKDSTIGVMMTGVVGVKNSLKGGSGDDTLTGGSKNDILTGGLGADVFVQSYGSRDTIADYSAADGDVISLQGALTNAKVIKSNVVLSTEAGDILVKNGVGQVLTTKVGDEETQSLFLDSEPTNASVSGEDLVVTAGGQDYTLTGKAADTVTFTVGDKYYAVEATRITDVTNAEAKSVTLSTDFTNTYYGLHMSYGAGVTAVDGTNASGKQLNVTGAKSTVDIELTGMAAAKNSLTGGAGNDTLTGGSKNDILTGRGGADVFVQSRGSRDTIADYSAADGDVISLQGALTNTRVANSNIVLSTEAGDILVKGGVGQVLTTKVGNEETQSLFLGSEPTNASVSGEDLVVTAGGQDYTLAGQAADTVTFTVGDKQYAVEATRITDVTDENAKSVTLSTDFTNTYYGLHMSYGAGVTAVDGTNASGKQLNVTGAKSTVDIELTGMANAKNSLTGGSGNDTLTGGSKNDVLTGRSGADVFVQSYGSRDTIADYSAIDGDVIVLQSKLTNTRINNKNVVLSTEAGDLLVKNGVGQAITTKVGADGTESAAYYLTAAPIDTTVRSGNLIVTTESGNYTLGASSDTVTVVANGNTYTASRTRITDITDAHAKSVTLASGYTSTAYNFDANTALLDASNAKKALTIDASNAEAGVNIKGSATAQNVITGSNYDDTLAGGSVDDSIRGGEGNDWFVQTAGTDTIADYANGDTLQLLSRATKAGRLYSNSYQYTTAEGRVILNNGYDKNRVTVLGGAADVANSDDELWGVNGKKDNFLFDGGKDTIHNYEEEDVISLADCSLSDLINGAPSISDKNLVFNFDKANSLTISDVAGNGTPVTFDDGTTYSYNGKEYTRK